MSQKVKAGVEDGLHILLVEDNDDLSRNIAAYLERLGHRLDFAVDGADGARLACSLPVDLVILDVSLPKMNGFDVCRAVRAQSTRHVPILMLTARDTLPDKLAGFDAGADDYLTKPFELAELAARCMALSRRHRVAQDHELVIGPLRIDRRRQAVSRAGQDLKLHPLGYRILLILAEAHPGVVTRSELSERLWSGEPPESDALRTHLYLLRQALDRPFDWPMLVTVHSVGFRLQTEA